MDPIATPKKPALEVTAAHTQRSEPGPAAQAAQKRFAEHIAAARQHVMPNKAHVEMDAQSQRFVHTLTDAESSETLRRYPNETQLAYSRAVMAYLRARDAQ